MHYFLQLYHACDQDVFSFCLMKYTVLQFCDFYTATMAYWVTILAMGGVPDQAKSLLHMVISFFIFIFLKFVIFFSILLGGRHWSRFGHWVRSHGCIHFSCSSRCRHFCITRLVGKLTSRFFVYEFLKYNANRNFIRIYSEFSYNLLLFLFSTKLKISGSFIC